METGPKGLDGNPERTYLPQRFEANDEENFL